MFVKLLLLATVFFLIPSVSLGQIDTGSVVGVVRDPSGAAIAGATVTLKNNATGVTRVVTTNEDGSYQFAAILPGVYSVQAAATNFESAISLNIEINVQSRPAIDFTLKLGQSNQVIEVSSIGPILQTETADVGGVVQSQQINDLPLNGRRYSDLALLEAGIQRNQVNQNNTAPDRFSSNGNLETQNYFSLDGIDNNSGSTNLQESSVQVIQPPPDALQEFKIQTRTYSSEFGTAAGAVINATIKSGTNQFHGDVWEFLRNSSLDANSYFNNLNGVPRGRFTQNQYGATIGGPVLKNKTFFFADFQIFTSRQATTVQSTVPTPLMKTGNFTELSQTLSNSPVSGQSGCVAGNMIASGCLDSTATKLVALFPDPNIPNQVANEGVPGSWNGAPNYQFQYSIPKDTHSFDVRVDHSVNDKNHIFGRYSQFIINNQDPPWTKDPVAGNGNFATAYNIHERSVAIAWDDTLKSSLVNEVRFGFNRDFAHSDPIGLQLGKSLAPDFGLSGIPVSANSAGIPPIEINGLTRIGTSPWRPQFQISQVWQVLDNLTWLKGNHSFKFGYEYRHWSNNFLDIRAPQGEIGVNGIYTAAGSFGLPDFLLGNVDSTVFVTPTVVHNFTNGNSVYAQDTWRARKNLTLTFGVRYELYSPLLNHQNRLSNFSPANGGELVTPPSGASGWFERSLIHPDKNNFAPRFGFSYHPWERLVFRGGFGLFYQQGVRIGSESILALNPPAVFSYNLSQSQGSTTPVFQLQNGFPINQFTSTTVDLTQLQIRAQDPNQRTGYVEQGSFGPQFQITPNLSLDVSYVGNFARKMNRLRDGNQGIFTGNFDGSGNPIDIYPYANLNTTNSSATGSHGFLELATNDGNTNYNALLVSLRRRFSKGVSYGISYTWSHNIGDYVDNLTGGAFPQNAYNYGAERGDSMFDVRHRFVGFLTYDLPVGKGKRFLNQGGPASYVLGGWQVNTIFTKQTGTTIQLAAPDSSLSGGAHISRPNCIGDGRAGASDDPRKGLWLNPAAFALPGTGQFGNCGVGRYHGPGFTNADISLFKAFPIRETMKLEFRTEFFNAFNHANFSNPGSFFPFGFGIISSTVGDPREIQFGLKFYF
ncbi:MAG: TonB-dependent receptor [Acidobacteria bacterium]|nr:TonB-dependent receptor [Acidobacteriota bacterium]MBS1866903.1 TonB-dependent receptor [Acidobacteriota bacterium]